MVEMISSLALRLIAGGVVLAIGATPLAAKQGAPPVAAPRALDFQGLAQQFKTSNGLETLPADDTAVAPALDKAFLSIDVGLFDVRYLRSELKDTRHFEDLKGIVLGLIDLHARLLAWVGEKDPGKTGMVMTPALTTFRAWVEKWKADLLLKAMASKSDSHELAVLAGADAAVLAAIKESAESLRNGSAAGFKLDLKPTRLALLPSRGDFTGFASYVGSLQPEWKTILWTAALNVRHEFHINDLIGLPLEAPAPDGGPVGPSMNDREKTGLFEHVTQYAGDKLLKEWFGALLDPGLEMGASINLVIELYGENNSRVFGSGEGKSTPGKNKFVRGGKSTGGKFAKQSADSRWRTELGKDYFVTQLRRAQSDGMKFAGGDGKTAPSPNAHFILDTKTPGEHDWVSAPFLGSAAATKEVGEDFHADYQEFLRSYRSCFVHWLATTVKPKVDPPQPRPLSRLLRTSLSGDGKSFDERVAACFGIPLSSPAPATDALEWQFLEWLSRQK
jgi:hypothetical protein